MKNYFLAAVFLFIFCSCFSINAQYTNINLTNNDGQGEYEPAVAISHLNTNLAVVTFLPAARYCYTTDGGITWSLPAFVDSNLSVLLEYPQVCTDNSGNFYISAVNNTIINIYKSTNGGRNFVNVGSIPGSVVNTDR